jgi:Fe-S cluster biogenesis protein NfuA
MTFREKVAQAVQELEPKLEELTQGHVELLNVDEEKGSVTLKLIGGRLN